MTVSFSEATERVFVLIVYRDLSTHCRLLFIASTTYRSGSGTGMQMHFWMLDSEDALTLVERISQACDEAKRKRTARMEGTAERQAEVTFSF